MRASRSNYPQTIDARTRAPLAVKDQTFDCASEPAPLRAKEQKNVKQQNAHRRYASRGNSGRGAT